MAADALGDGSKEVELKLEFDPADAGRIEAHPALAASPPEKQALISIYYDTGDGALRRAGVYLRVRDNGTRYVQTIKAAKSDAELLERYEWEREVPGREPDLDAAEGTALAPLLTPEVRESLRPLFVSRIRRTIHRLEQGGAEIEMAIDEGEIVSSTRQCAVSEVELELKRGEPAALFRLARILAETLPLRLAVKTKAERGFELLEGGAQAVEKAASVDIHLEMPSAEAFRAIARNCLRQIIANEPAMCASNAEALHQMRIGLRRLRAAISLFADMVADAALDRIKAELQWITKELGPARDLDVFAVEVLQPLQEAHPEDADVAETHRNFAERRAEAYAQAAGSIRSDRFRAALLDLAEWTEIGPWTHEDGAEREALRVRPAAEHARKALRRLRKQIRHQGSDLDELSVSQLHRLRIRAKRLRYATEFFAATFPGAKAAKRREKSLAALKDLQDALGSLNDLAMRQTLIGEETAGHARGDYEANVDRLLASAEKAYKKFSRAKPFWKA
ncbi:MAG TPA: CHAD domain-containing protein [Methyloceanibacter sp.]|nr:CHAD domain-containing protein [Methyloceanibacter sp.]